MSTQDRNQGIAQHGDQVLSLREAALLGSALCALAASILSVLTAI